MPTIDPLPTASGVTLSDLVPISQAGTTRSTNIGALLGAVQPAIVSDTGTLLGRNSAGAGGPEAVAVGPGLTLSQGTLAAVGLESAAQIGSMSSSDMVCISRAGTLHTIQYAQFLDGETIDQAQPASPAGDSDSFWVAQGSGNTMVRQTLSAVWGWTTTKLPFYKRPVVEVAFDTTLDATVHNGRILVCTQPVVLSPAFTNMGSGFSCDVINLSGGGVTFDSGITTSSGSSMLAPGQSASLRAFSVSTGNVVFASVSGAVTAPSVSPPGPVLALGATNVTPSAITLTWTAPTSGGAVASYTVQYRLSGTTNWSTTAAAISGATATVTGLSASTSYDFRVFASNAGGAGSAITTSATTAAVPGAVTAITWNLVPTGSYAAGNGSIGVNAHVTPATAEVQFGFSNSNQIPPNTWAAALFVNTDLWGAYVPTPATAGNWYLWGEGTDGSSRTVFPTSFAVT